LTEAFGDYQRKGLIIEDAIGCGAAAQVYRGKLAVKTDSTEPENKEPAREVAIKVLHPRFREMVDRDLDFLEIISDIAHSLPITYIKMLNIPRAFEEFSVVLRDQVDLTIEAENLRQLRKNFYKNSQEKEEKSSIIFPKPIDGWIAPHAIVEEYVSDAVPIANYLLDSSQDGMAIRKELAAPLLRAFLKMVFIDNFIHGDLHPVC
jgi:aarF domain-containing kinase